MFICSGRGCQVQSTYIFSNYTIYRRHSQRTHTHLYEYTHVNPTPRSIFEDCVGKSLILTKSPQASRCRRERRLPLKEQTPLNFEKFATGALVTTRLSQHSTYIKRSRWYNRLWAAAFVRWWALCGYFNTEKTVNRFMLLCWIFVLFLLGRHIFSNFWEDRKMFF
jgi:hypothetical protein